MPICKEPDGMNNSNEMARKDRDHSMLDVELLLYKWASCCNHLMPLEAEICLFIMTEWWRTTRTTWLPLGQAEVNLALCWCLETVLLVRKHLAQNGTHNPLFNARPQLRWGGETIHLCCWPGWFSIKNRHTHTTTQGGGTSTTTTTTPRRVWHIVYQSRSGCTRPSTILSLARPCHP